MSWLNQSKVVALLIVQMLILLSCVGWILVDPLAADAIIAFSHSTVTLDFGGYLTRFGWARCIAILVLLLIACRSGIREGRRCLFSKPSKLTIQRLLTLTVVVACWLGLIVNFHAVVWQGKKLRSAHRLSALEQLAVDLLDDWPQDAGEIEGLGPFTAYPFGRPRLLLLLTPRPLGSTNTVITAIERSDDGSLRFELGGDDGGEWIEWHPIAKQPASFCGSLKAYHRLQQSAQLSDQWYLVRYFNTENLADDVNL